jgi:hypothetical protein
MTPREFDHLSRPVASATVLADQATSNLSPTRAEREALALTYIAGWAFGAPLRGGALEKWAHVHFGDNLDILASILDEPGGGRAAAHARFRCAHFANPTDAAKANDLLKAFRTMRQRTPSFASR